MPLTPAEVHNVVFKKPPIGKRGYDEEEVDAFLDIIEVELARLIEENADLKDQSPGGGASGDGAAALTAAHEENRKLTTRIGELEAAVAQARQSLVQAQQEAAAAAKNAGSGGGAGNGASQLSQAERVL